MFKLITNKYILFAILLNLILITKLDFDYILIYLFNICSIFAYYFTLESQFYKPLSHYNTKQLSSIVLIYSLFFVFTLNFISDHYNQNYFVFSEVDAMVYHFESIQMISAGYTQGMSRFLSFWGYEDLGAVLVISTLYRLVESNLIVNFFYIICGLISSLLIFRIGQGFMSKRYAYMCALAYSTASFVLWFHSSGLKESFLVFLVILFFDRYYEYMKRRKVINVLFGGLSLLGILLFRPAISFILLASILLPLLYTKDRLRGLFFFLFFLLIGFFSAYNQLNSILYKFIGSDTSSMIAGKEASGMVIGSLPFTYVVNLLAGAIGPLPTIVPSSEKILLTFYSSGLIFRVFFSSIFWFGFYYAYKGKVTSIFPLLFFIILEGSSLIFILEGLELRKSLPHFFAIFLISFWFLDFFRQKNTLTRRSKDIIVRTVKLSGLFFFLVILFWNLR